MSETHSLFIAAQTLWLSMVADPGVLMLLRVSSAVFSVVASTVAIRAALATDNLEMTWSPNKSGILFVNSSAFVPMSQQIDITP